jgi:hypothetical protein
MRYIYQKQVTHVCRQKQDTLYALNKNVSELL